jgi:hypothetical protein
MTSKENSFNPEEFQSIEIAEKMNTSGAIVPLVDFKDLEV